LGVARVVDGKTATAETLCGAIESLDESCRAKARALAESVRLEDGASMAALGVAALIVRRERILEEANP
jgi:hypothetical protein